MFKLFKKKIEKEEAVKEVVTATAQPQNNNSESEIAAAIGVALSLYIQNVHDYENMILTINKVVRPYSPWSSKIYGLSQNPRR